MERDVDMRFYDALQLDPQVLKGKIRDAADKKEKRWYLKALILRDILIVLAAVCFVVSMTACFGEQNSSMAVVIFCILLTVRFVDFHYRVWDGILNLGVIFLLLLISPMLVQAVNPWLGAVVNFCSMWLILLMSSQRPEMGNGGLYMFGYLFLTGSAIDRSAAAGRIGMTAAGFLICACIFYRKHRHRHPDKAFRHIIKKISIRDELTQWHIQTALGISILYLLGSLAGMERLMWAGFACSSLLTAYTSDIRERAVDRILGVVAGSLLFAGLCMVLPESLIANMGLISGLCLGFCGHYRYKTVFNCFGALLTAAGIYGLGEAVSMRIFNNIAGVVFAVVFAAFCRKLMDVLAGRREMGEICQQPD